MRKILLSLLLFLIIPVFAFAQATSTGQSKLLQNAATATGNGQTISTERWSGVRGYATISNTATITLEVSYDGGTTWVATDNAYKVGASATPISTLTSTGAFVVVTNGMPFRARISSYGSGTVTVRATQIFLTVAKATGGGSIATDSIWDAAGDLAVGTGTNTASRLPIGTANQFLQVNGDATGLEWATLAGGGDALVADPLSQFAATTSAQLRGVLSDESGNGAALFANGALGAATATSINKVAFTAPASAATLTIADGKTLTISNSITFAGTDSTVMTFPSTSATIARTDAANTFTGVQTMTSPSVTTSLVTGSTTFALLNTTATTVNAFGAATSLNIGAAAATVLNFGGHTSAAEFRFLEPSGSGTNYSAFKAVAQGASITYSLPPTVGAAGTVLTDVAGDGVLSWEAGGGGGGAPTDATYILQTANGSLSAEQALSSLSSGIMRVATTTGVITSLTDSAGIAANISDETGTGVLVFGTSPAFTTSISTPLIITASGALTITPNSNANIFLNTTGLIQLSTTDSTAPAFKRNGTSLQLRLADDSAYAGAFATSQFDAYNGVNRLWYTYAPGGEMAMSSGYLIGWSSSATAAGSSDTAVGRNVAGVIEINNGSGGTFRDLLARGLRSNAVAFASAIGSPVEGTIQAFTDSSTATWGDTITGGGANHVLGYFNGTNWTVIGK